MSFVDPSLDPNAQGDPSPQTPPPAPVIQGIEQGVHDAVVRENAVLKALPGVDLSSPLATMFVNSYTGELTPEAINEAATLIGLVKAPETPPEHASPEDLQQQNLREQMQQGGFTPPPNQEELDALVHPSDAGYAEMQKRIDGGLGRDDAAAAVINALTTAAAKGDERATWTGWTEAQLAGREPTMRVPAGRPA